LQQLIDLQDIDRRIQVLEGQAARLPLEIEESERALARAREEVERFRLTISEMEKKRRAMEREADYAREELIKKRRKLLEVKSNKEYAAMQAEIAHAEKEISDKEDQVLQLLMEMDERNDEGRRRAMALADLEQQCKVEQQKRMAELEVKRAELADLLARRNHLSGMIESSLFTTYQKVFELRKGLAVVNLVNGTCQGCHMTLPPQIVSEVKQNERIITCGECDRILYFREEE